MKGKAIYKVTLLIMISVLVFVACSGGGGGGAGTNPTYIVTYNGNNNTGGSVPTDSTNYEQGQTVTVLGNTGNLVNKGYSFAGWNTQANGTGTTYTQAQTFTMGTTNVTLYARWTANLTYTVTYNGNGNTGGSVPVDTTNYEQGQTVTVLANTGNLVNNGYSFAGWNTQSDGTGTTYTQAQTFTMGTTNVALCAKWTANPMYTVSGTISGLNGTGLVLQNNGGDDLSISSTGTFNFATAVADGAGYNVMVKTQPSGPSQACMVSSGSGTVSGANVTNVSVLCTTNATLSDIHSAVTASIVSMLGNELTVFSGTTNGFTITFLGYALCMPTDPYAPPAAQATPPENLYGCQNNATLTLTPAADTITFTYTAPQVYVDLQTYSSLTGTDAGYLLYTNVTATVTASLSTASDGRKQIGSVIANSLSSESITFASQDAFVNTMGTLIVNAVQSTLSNHLSSVFADFTGQVISTLPPYEP